MWHELNIFVGWEGIHIKYDVEREYVIEKLQ
jgi:hypothetical protein